jgi:hypothetical protein
MYFITRGNAGAPGQGGSAVAAGVQGPQRSSRQEARANPAAAPWREIIASAYRLQLGWKRQRTPSAASGRAAVAR